MTLREEFEQAFKDELSGQAYLRGGPSIRQCNECALWAARWALEKGAWFADKNGHRKTIGGGYLRKLAKELQ